MRRIYFLLPSIEEARDMVGFFRAEGVQEDRLHLLARHDVEMEDLPRASFADYSDLVPALERGLALGGTTGLVAGLAAVAFPPAGVAIGGGAIAAITAAGAGIGAWAASLVGAGMTREQIAECQDELEKGAVLVMVDVDDADVDETRRKVQQWYPDVTVRDIERLLVSPSFLSGH